MVDFEAEVEVEKAIDSGEDEEGQRLLHECESFGRTGAVAADLERRRREHQKLFFVLCTLLLAFAALGFLSYRFILPRRWKLSTFLEDPQSDQDRGLLAIRLRPELHKQRAAQDIEHDWVITSGIRAPDGVQKEVYLINGKQEHQNSSRLEETLTMPGAFPGPTVEARSGDRLIIHVRNNLTDEQGLSIHWHGLFMRNANDMDGTLGLTQSAIPQGGAMKYEFEIADDQCGTFWYHAHSQLQRADGLYGGLIIHCPVNGTARTDDKHIQFESEQLLLLGDWYHRPAKEVLAWYHHWRSFGNEVLPFPPSSSLYLISKSLSQIHW